MLRPVIIIVHVKINKNIFYEKVWITFKKVIHTFSLKFYFLKVSVKEFLFSKKVCAERWLAEASSNECNVSANR